MVRSVVGGTPEPRGLQQDVVDQWTGPEARSISRCGSDVSEHLEPRIWFPVVIRPGPQPVQDAVKNPLGLIESFYSGFIFAHTKEGWFLQTQEILWKQPAESR